MVLPRSVLFQHLTTLTLPRLAQGNRETARMLGACASSTLKTFLSTAQGFTHSSTTIVPVSRKLRISLHLFQPLHLHLHILRYVLAACSNGGGPENCQSNIFSLEGSVSNINVYCLNTIGTTNMITQNGKALASYSDNVSVFPDTIALFTTGAVVVPPTSPSLLGWNYRGCYTDAYPGRTLGNLVQIPGGAAAMTIEACITSCSAAGYSLAGVEYGGECCKLSMSPRTRFPFLIH